MSDELKHECAVAMVVLRRSLCDRLATDFGGAKLSLLMEKQHNRGQDGAGAAILSANPEPGEEPYWIAKSASSTPLVDVLGAIAKRSDSFSHKERKEHKEEEEKLCDLCDLCGKKQERIFLGHLRYATFGKNEMAFCHPFVHEASELEHTLLLAGNFNLTNARELFEEYRRKGEFPTSRADGYLICELIAHELEQILPSRGVSLLSLRGEQETRSFGEEATPKPQTSQTPSSEINLSVALSKALANADGAWTLCGATGDGWAFATRDPHGIRPGFYYVSDDVVAVASERPAIQAAFDVPPEDVKELPPGQALIVSPAGEVQMSELSSTIKAQPRHCSFERIYFSRANDADIHRERKALGAALMPQVLKAADAPLEDIFFSYIPNSARIAFHGLLEELIKETVAKNLHSGRAGVPSPAADGGETPFLPVFATSFPRFGEVIVKDAKFRTFIADAAARREFYKHVYDVTYGLVRPGLDTLVVLDDSIVRGNTMKNAILPMLDRLGPKHIVIASSAPPIRYPDCYGIDMSTLDELVAFRALVNLLDGDRELREALGGTRSRASAMRSVVQDRDAPVDPLAPLYARFTHEQHCAEIARLLTPPSMKAKVSVVFQTVDSLHAACPNDMGDWYFTGNYPTLGGYKVLHRALLNYLAHKDGRSY